MKINQHSLKIEGKLKAASGNIVVQKNTQSQLIIGIVQGRRQGIPPAFDMYLVMNRMVDDPKLLR